jgi:tight adherence protein B
MMPALLACCALLATSLAALLYRFPARRRERALGALSPDATARRKTNGFRRVLDMRSSLQAGDRRVYIIIATAGLLAFAFTRSLLITSLAWPATILVRRLLERHKRVRARIKKEEQILEFIDSLSQSLRAGLSLRQSLEISLEDVGDELGEDVLEILKDIRVGCGLEESLANAAEGSSSPSLRLTFSVLALMHGRGGDLPRILERLRKRVASGLEARREARILTSQSRASGYLVSSLPAVFLLLQVAMNPRSLHPLFTTPMGNLIIAVALALNAAAFILIRKMIDQEV